SDAGAAKVAIPSTRSSPAAVTIASVPPSRKPAIHTPVTSPRASSASTAARTSASQPSIEKSPSEGPVPRKVNVKPAQPASRATRSEEHTSELQSLAYLVCRLLLEKKNPKISSYRADEPLILLPVTLLTTFSEKWHLPTYRTRTHSISPFPRPPRRLLHHLFTLTTQ